MQDKWIIPVQYSGNGPTVFHLRRRFTVKEKATPAILRLCADTFYIAKLNGFEVGRGPIRGTDKWQFYDEFEVSRFIHNGENELFIFSYFASEESFTFNSVCPGVFAELTPYFTSDTAGWEGRTDNQFQFYGLYYSVPIGFMENRDLRAVQNNWEPAVIVKNEMSAAKSLLQNPLPPPEIIRLRPAKLLAAYTAASPLDTKIENIKQSLQEQKLLPLPKYQINNLNSLFSSHSACTIKPPEDGFGVRLILEFPHEISGGAEITLHSEADTKMELSYGDAIHKDRVITNFQSGFAVNHTFTDVYTLSEGENKISNMIGTRGFRVLQISLHNFKRPLTITQIHGINRRYPWKNKGKFNCSDYFLSRLFQVCGETLRACTSDVLMDCPWRERTCWVNDMLVSVNTSLRCFGASSLHKHNLTLALSQHHPSGLIYAVVPQPKLPIVNDFIFAATNLGAMQMVYDFYMFSGDTKTVKQLLPEIEQILNAMWSYADKEGIIKVSGIIDNWNFLDWSMELNGYTCNHSPKLSILTSMFIIAAKQFIQVAEESAFDIDKNLWKKRYLLSANNFEKRFFNPETGFIDEVLLHNKQFETVPTQLSHALWLLTNEGTPQVRACCKKAMLNEKMLMPDYYLHSFWLRAAARNQLKQAALNRIRKYWGPNIETGYDTLFEIGIHQFGAAAFDNAGSLCHAFATAPVEFMQEAILGITPLKPGFREFVFQPDLLDLSDAAGSIPTPNGNIEVELNKKEFTISIPDGCTLTMTDGTKYTNGKFNLKQED